MLTKLFHNFSIELCISNSLNSLKKNKSVVIQATLYFPPLSTKQILFVLVKKKFIFWLIDTTIFLQKSSCGIPSSNSWNKWTCLDEKVWGHPHPMRHSKIVSIPQPVLLWSQVLLMVQLDHTIFLPLYLPVALFSSFCWNTPSSVPFNRT